MARVRGGGGGRWPCSSLDSTARSPDVLMPVEEEGEEVVGPSSAWDPRLTLLDSVRLLNNYNNNNNNNSLSLLPKPNPNAVVPMPIFPNPRKTTFSCTCNICGKKFNTHRAMWGHKGSHARIRTTWPKTHPNPSAQNAVRPQPTVSLELGLALGNGATRGSTGLVLRPLGPTREGLRFKELLARPVFDLTVQRLNNNPTQFAQPLTDEELELKLGV